MIEYDRMSLSTLGRCVDTCFIPMRLKESGPVPVETTLSAL
jgi:hypothetical protein